jgi:hypothetical protein
LGGLGLGFDATVAGFFFAGGVLVAEAAFGVSCGHSGLDWFLSTDGSLRVL